MKKIIKAKRVNNYSIWRASANNMIACNSDVDDLFYGLTQATECIFEITTRRPRTPDYHRFEYEYGTYRTTSETRGHFNLTRQTSMIMRRLMKKVKVIYVAVYTEE